MIDTLLKSILAPITNLIASRINNKIQSIEYVNNMYNLLSSNYKSRLYIKNMLHVSHPVLFKDIYCPLSIAKLTTHEYDESSQIFNIKSVSTLMYVFRWIPVQCSGDTRSLFCG